MTVAALAASIAYVENGVTVAFAAPFRYLAATDLVVQRVTAAGVVTTLTYGVDYTATAGPTDAGGTVTVTAAAAAGTELRIKRRTARSQGTQYPAGDRFPAASHEAALDRAMLIAQEQDDEQSKSSSRALLVPDGETIANLPASASRASRLTAFDADGDPTPGPLTAAVESIVAAAFNPALAQFAENVAYTSNATGAGAQSVKAKLDDWIHFSDFRVIAASDQAAAELAIASGRDIFLPRGEYEVKNLTFDQSNVTWFGSGTLKFNGTDPTTERLASITGDDVAFEGITFSGGALQPRGSLVYVDEYVLRPKFVGCWFRDLLGTTSGALVKDQMYALCINPYGVVGAQVLRCHFVDLLKYNDNTYFPEAIGSGFVGGMMFWTESLADPVAAQPLPTSCLVQSCEFDNIRTVLRAGLTQSEVELLDDADGIRTYGISGAADRVNVTIADCRFRRCSKRWIKSACKGVTVKNIRGTGDELPYSMTSIVKLTNDCSVDGVDFQTTDAFRVNTAFQYLNTPGELNMRAAFKNATVTHAKQCVEVLIAQPGDSIINVEVSDCHFLDFTLYGYRRASGDQPTTQQNLLLKDCSFFGSGAAAVGIECSNAVDITCGLTTVGQVFVKNAQVVVAGINNDLSGIKVLIDDPTYLGTGLPNQPLVRVGAAGYGGIQRIFGMRIDATAINAAFLSATRPKLVELYGDNMTIEGLVLYTPDTLTDAYPHIELGGATVKLAPVDYIGRGTFNIGVDVAVTELSAAGLTRYGSGACTLPFIKSTHASNTACRWSDIDDKRPATVATMDLADGALGAGDTYSHLVVSQTTRSAAALPVTTSRRYYGSIVKY